jgi:hypothetical protein
MRVFGCPVYVHVDKSQRRKLDDREWKGVFVGHGSLAWVVYNPATRRVVSIGNVVFNESAKITMGKRCPKCEVLLKSMVMTATLTKHFMSQMWLEKRLIHLWGRYSRSRLLVMCHRRPMRSTNIRRSI